MGKARLAFDADEMHSVRDVYDRLPIWTDLFCCSDI